MRTVDIFIGTSLRGSAKGTGKVMYVMRTTDGSGKSYESAPEVGEYDDSTESSLVIKAVRDALGRLKYACRVVVHTHCNFIASTINQHWAEKWRSEGWTNSRGEEVRNAVLWSMVLEEIEDAGHILEAQSGPHEYTQWMQWAIQSARAANGYFRSIKKGDNS